MKHNSINKQELHKIETDYATGKKIKQNFYFNIKTKLKLSKYEFPASKPLNIV